MSALDRARDFVRERLALGRETSAMIDGGASFAYVFGSVLTMLFVVEALTGFALASFYSPSSTDAWASVAYIQDQAAWGWIVRGIHHHGASAIVIIAGIHLIQTALAGAYRRPRELVWWLGLLLLVISLAWSVTGYVLRWDQAGYWANRVEIGIAAGTPVIGEHIRSFALGGNEYGNLTLTRFYALHVILLPIVVTIVLVAHVRLARRHGTTAVQTGAPAPRWPDQAMRDIVVFVIMLVVLLAYVVQQHGTDLWAPADPANAFDARPLWYFRWLFHLREMAGSAEKLVAMAVPAVIGGFLAALPRLDRGTSALARRVWLGVLAAILAMIAGLTVMSFAKDADDADLTKRTVEATKLADRARALARDNGVPSTGAADVFATQPFYRARTIYAKACKGCHEDPKDRKGPLIEAGHNDRAWLKAFLQDPSHARFWGKTKLVKLSLEAQQLEDQKQKAAPPDKPETPGKPGKGKATPEPKAEEPAEDPNAPKDLAMKPTSLQGRDLDDVVELVYAQGGPGRGKPIDKAAVERGGPLFESACSDCHSIVEGVSGTAPNLFGFGSRDYYRSFISNPKSGLHMTAVEQMSQMPRFDKELSLQDRDALGEYLAWLRNATPGDLATLGAVYP
ncbi:MAG TPA: cytochrome b N-terminal domain-containing protein [Kofleriaceae bacterium]|nr:cytochrome b N-terminal domain-containing protein [Kofleriaceae bacterium]